MEINIKLSKDEGNLVLEALNYYQNTELSRVKNSIENAKYKSVEWLYKDKETFDADIENRKDDINNKIAISENIYQNIVDEMEE